MPLDPMIYREAVFCCMNARFWTVWSARERTTDTAPGHPHSCLEEVLEIARAAEVGRLAATMYRAVLSDDRFWRGAESGVRQKVTFPAASPCRGGGLRRTFSLRPSGGEGGETAVKHGDQGDTGKGH